MKRTAIITWVILMVFSSIPAFADISFQASFAGQQTIDNKDVVAVTFSEPLDPAQNSGEYFSILTNQGITPGGAWVVDQDPQIVYFANIDADTEYRIQVRKGLRAASGKILDALQAFVVKTRRVEPMIRFGSKGFILASKLSRGLPVTALNVDKADIDFFRVKPGFFDEFSKQFRRSDQIYYHWSRSLNKYADLTYTGRWDLDINKNLRTPVNIPITHIEELKKPGIYFAVLRGAGKYDYSYSTTWFTISDLGVHVRKYSGFIQVHIQSLETARPVENVRITGYNKDGKALLSVTSDEKGMARISRNPDEINYIVSESDQHISLLPMDTPALDLSEFRTAVAPFFPTELFVYGPRDLYRPGELVILDGLLRNQDGQMTTGLPLQAKIIRPDGKMVHEFTWKGSGLNHYQYTYSLPGDAITGIWRITFTHAGSPLNSYEFVVAEFLPERMKLDIKSPAHPRDLLGKDEDLTMELKGDYLYGAPAARNKADAMIHLRPGRELFSKEKPGYEFGDATDRFRQSFKTDSIKLDDQGKGRLIIKNRWKTTGSPLLLTANASLYESGGRPVVRNKTWQIWPADHLIGIRSLAGDDGVKADSTAEFEVIAMDKQGIPVGVADAKAVLIREQRDYYWEFRQGVWQWQHTSRFYPVDRFTVTIPKDGPAQVKVPVKWGGYRLEITNPVTGLTSGFRIWAGWRQPTPAGNKGINRPDRVDLILDKPGYHPGEKADVSVKAPEGGSGYLFVESDTNLLTLPIEVPKEGRTFSIDIDPSWQRHDLYISAVIVRKGESQTGHLPKRSVGLIRLPLDRKARKLVLDMDIPDKTEPKTLIDIPITLTRQDGSIPEEAYVTLAAVDSGVLSLSRFKTPDPHDYFFQGRRYGVNLHDMYQQLIEENEGRWGRQRFGGDAPQLSRGGDRPATDVQIVSLYQGAVKTDADGKASFKLDLPYFNGQVRIMAVAHTGKEFGSSEHELTIASPLVTQIAMPRFLSMGDKSRLVLDVHNSSESVQNISVTFETSRPVRLLSETKHQLTLGKGEKKEMVFPVFAEQRIGRSQISCTIEGLVVAGEERRITRSWFLETRPAYPAITRGWRKRLEPGASFTINPEDMNGLLSETIAVQAGVSSSPPINISEHIQQLFAYPYGCLEQTTSGLYPHVIIGSLDFARLGLKSDTPNDRTRKIKLGIQRLIEKQKSTGGFGLWNAASPETHWLTAYAAHFLLNAGEAGYEIPGTAYRKTLERLQVYVRRPGTISSRAYVENDHYKAASRAYAAFILARARGISLGDARSLYDAVSKDLKGALGFVHMGLALYFTGDEALGLKAFDTALEKKRDVTHYYGDYGSDLRDFAMAYYLLSRFVPDYPERSEFLFKTIEELDQRKYLSTQERNGLVMAGSIHLKAMGEPWKADITKGSETLSYEGKRLFQTISRKGESSAGFGIRNQGTQDLYINVMMAGYPDQQPLAQIKGARIKRRYLDTSGQELSTRSFTTGDRVIVELEFEADKRISNCLVADLLPAGMELEDPGLAGSTRIGDIIVGDKTIDKWHGEFGIQHREYRDDRFVGVLTIEEGRAFRLFYPVRVVVPGEFIVPPPLIEDMYRPYIRGIGDAIALMTITNP